MKKKALSDMQRIREIIKILIEPYEDMHHMNVETKLYYTIQPEKYPIVRRKILKSMPVFGMWWMDEEQYCRYLWNGHKGVVVRSDQDPDRVMASRSFIPKGFCYIRENANGTYDLEAMSMSYDGKKSIKEWMTVTVQKDEYELLDSFLGPVHDGCKHNHEGVM